MFVYPHSRPKLRQENLPTEAGGVDSLILMEDSLIIEDDVMMEDSLIIEDDVIPGLNITSPPSGEHSTVITGSSPEGLLKERSGVSNMSYTSFEHDISNLLDDSIFAGKILTGNAVPCSEFCVVVGNTSVVHAKTCAPHTFCF